MARPKPHGYLIDDSNTYRPWFCHDHEFAEKRMREGKRVIPLYLDPLDGKRPSKQAHDDHHRAQLILRDHEAMEAIRRIRALAKVGDGVTLAGVADALEAKLRAH